MYFCLWLLSCFSAFCALFFSLLRVLVQAGPVVTDNGNFVVDVDFGLISPSEVAALDGKLQAITGIVETGLFVAMAKKAYFGNADGSVTVRDAPKQ